MESAGEGTQESWRQSWKAWFSGSEGSQARDVLGAVREYDMVGIPDEAAPELRRITKLECTTTDEDLRGRLESLTVHELRRYIAGEVSDLKDAETGWQKKRNAGPKKATTKIQEFVVAADSFLSSFAGVVEVVKLADNQYGSAATTILAIFFVTVKLKASNDQAIQSSMRTIAHRLPDLDIYYQVFADSQLAMLLSRAYRDVLVFARAATLYYQLHGFRRLVKSIAQPNKFQDMEGDMAQNFKEIRTRCDALLAKRICDLSSQNKELINQIRSLQIEVKGLHHRNDQEAATALRGKMGRQQSDPKTLREKKLHDHCKLLRDIFAPYQDDLELMTLDKLRRTPEYQKWQDTRTSMLVLHGVNHADCAGVSQSWLSLSALQLVQDLCGPESGRVVAHCNCEPLMAVSEVLKSIIEQLLEQQPHVVRRQSGIDDISHGLGLMTGKGNLTGAATDGFNGCCHAAAEIVRRCQDPLYVVVNQPELCRELEIETWDFIKALIHLVEDAPGQLKVLVVLRTELWDIQQRVSYLDKDILDSNKLVILRRDQEELDP
ncbi:hypothetical protein CEP51_015670 [Fusarium floridanum]|uniref:DUF7708 domain-containing protein n=1 Tax=Fusarium floridanum TaxID=1325733 RepID=A0A428P588_9HYPO|nr:hypothetical protein CEP51_015670 [Fusarium floridanum]